MRCGSEEGAPSDHFRKLQPNHSPQKSRSGFSRSPAIQPKTSVSTNHQQPDSGSRTGMGKEWIENLAQDIRQKGHEAAENYGRSQHKAEIATAQGKVFFTDFVISLEDDVNEIKRQLQGDITSSDTIFQTITPTEVKLTRSRFPWFDARITHQDPIIVLDYAKGLGV